MTPYVPALLAPHPEWEGTYDHNGRTAVATRRKPDRPRHRRQDDDLRRAFPVPWRWRVRQGRQCLHLHASSPILITDGEHHHEKDASVHSDQPGAGYRSWFGPSPAA